MELQKHIEELPIVELTEDGIPGGPEIFLAYGIGGRGMCHPIEIFTLDEEGTQMYLVSFSGTKAELLTNLHKLSASAQDKILACQAIYFYR